MIDINDISTLQSAATLKSTASTAEAELLEAGVAKGCNLAANTGQTSYTWIGDLTDVLKQKLTSNGYTVTLRNRQETDVPCVWDISWK